MQDLIAANNLTDPDNLTVGQQLKIPSPSSGTPRPATPAATTAVTPPAGGQVYTVLAGDTACKIAANFKVTLQALADANGTTAAALADLKVGQVLKIPAASSGGGGCS